MKLYVDDIRVEREEVEVHYQRDPFPGGHRFTLTIPEPDVAAELDSEFDAIRRGENSEATEQFLLRYLRLFFLRKATARAPKYWLNRIDGCMVSKEQVVLTGVCSEHVL